MLDTVQPPLCLSVELTVAQVAKRMADVRTDSVILLGVHGDMKGILTDHDVARYRNTRTFRGGNCVYAVGGSLAWDAGVGRMC